ncbi:hypothetical protein KCP76_08125 [Salmonella enterica subsp. enterica serovar Weltevreden]|nr:hypothetical protein KCP76_08125 [Salmonella enterica subsp. enterica serovar Weltevreden]
MAAIETAAPQIAGTRGIAAAGKRLVKDEHYLAGRVAGRSETVEVIAAVEEEGEKRGEIHRRRAGVVGAGRSGGGRGRWLFRQRKKTSRSGSDRSGAGKPTVSWGFFARLKRSLLKPKKISVPIYQSVPRQKKIDDDCSSELKSSAVR